VSEFADNPSFDAIDLGATMRGFAPGMVMFGRYKLTAVIGRGGMGVVWQARDERLERAMALKFLPELVVRDKRAIADLKRETNRCLGLTHPHIVRVHDFVEDPALGLAAIAMEYIDGDNLSNLVAEREDRCFDVDELRPWLLQLCEALGYAHCEARVVHRDLKPANLMITSEGKLKVTDFGVARSLVDSASRVSGAGQQGAGTLVYMSPQQAIGRPATILDDVYALGATLYDLLTGRPPFFTGSIYQQVKEATAPAIAERRAELGVEDVAPIPAAWEQTIGACLAKDPAHRPDSVMEVAYRLGLVERAAPSAAKPISSPENHQVPPVGEVVVPSVPTIPPSRKSPLVSVAVLILSMAAAGGWYFGLQRPAQIQATRRAQELAAQQAREHQLAEARAKEKQLAEERARQLAADEKAAQEETERKRVVAEAVRLAKEKQEAEDAARAAEEKRAAEEASRIAEQKRVAEEAARQAELQRQQDEANKLAEAKRQAAVTPAPRHKAVPKATRPSEASNTSKSASIKPTEAPSPDSKTNAPLNPATDKTLKIMLEGLDANYRKGFMTKEAYDSQRRALLGK